MRIVSRPEQAVNNSTIPPGSRIYCAGNAATPQVLLRQIADDQDIKGVDLMGTHLLGKIGNRQYNLAESL